MTEQIKNLSVEDLIRLRDSLIETRKGIKKTSTKSTLKSLAGLLASILVTGGGVALAILVPGPLTIVDLGGAMFLTNKMNAVGMYKKMKTRGKERSALKTNISIIDVKLTDRKTESVVRNLYPNINSPSAPPPEYRPSARGMESTERKYFFSKHLIKRICY